MPVINQQKPTDKPVDPSKIENPIDRIMSVKALKKAGIRISIYGEPKTGKTRLVSSFPKPLLIIGTEDGTDSINNVDGLDFVLIKHTKEIPMLVQHAINKGYASLALDNATTLQWFVYKEMLGLEALPIQRSREQFKNIDNQEYSFNTKQALNELFQFRGNVIFTAHERDHSKKEEEKRDDRLAPKIGSSLSKGVAEWLNGICDHVVQTFKQEKIEYIDVEGTLVPQSTGKGEYCLRTSVHPVYMAGMRVPVGVYVPDYIVNPTYAKIREIIDGKVKQPTDK